MKIIHLPSNNFEIKGEKGEQSKKVVFHHLQILNKHLPKLTSNQRMVFSLKNKKTIRVRIC